jgi:hypothetical protein
MVTKTKALEIVSNDGFLIDTLPIELQKDNDIIITALKQSYFSLINIPIEHINEDILAFIFDNNYQEYYDEILDILDNYENNNVLQNANYNLKNNKKLIEILCVLNSRTIKYASEEILNDKNFFLNILKQYCGKYDIILKYLSDDLRDDEDIVKTLISKEMYTFEFEYASERLKKDYNFIFEVIKINGYIFKYIADELKNNRDIVLEAVKKNGEALKFTSKELKHDREIVLKAVQENGEALKFASKELKNDREIVLKAVQENGEALKFTSKKLKNDKDIVLYAVNNNGEALRFASEELKNNKYIALKAIKNTGYVLHIIKNGLNDNEKIISNAVKYKFDNFRYASDRLKTNKKFVLYLLQININIIEYLNNDLNDDDDIANYIIDNNIEKIKYLSERLQEKILLDMNINDDNIHILKNISKNVLDNKELILIILNKNYQVFNYISKRLKNDDDIVLFLISNKPKILSESYFKNKLNRDLIFKILELNLFSYLPIEIKKKFEDLESVYNHKETNIKKIIDIIFKNIEYFINDQYILSIIFTENLDKFLDIWYKNNSIRKFLIKYIENNEEFCNLLSEKYNIVFENIKMFDETLSIDNLDDERFINIKKLNESHIKKIFIYY